MCLPAPEYRRKNLMPEAPKTLFFCCLLLPVLFLSACAGNIEVQARGTMALSIGAGNR
jgi:hypothetical protein